MIVQDTLATAGPAAPPGDAPETLISWQNHSCDELRAIASRGAHGGELYFEAIKELERRAHDTEAALEIQEHEIAAGRTGQIWWLAVLIGAISIGAIAWVFGF